MIKFFLLICVVFAQNTTTGCAAGEYFNINSGEGGECVERKNCKTYSNDTLSGCLTCDTQYFLFREQCILCTCGIKATGEENNKTYSKNASICVDQIGCVECKENQVMIENKFLDGSVYYSCIDLPSASADPEKTTSPYELQGKVTRENCIKWGKRGCVECKGTFYVNNSMCYNNTYCSSFNSTTGGAYNPSTSNNCLNCTRGSTANDQSYYLLDGVCTPCDERCSDCELTTGHCKNCTGRFYPLDAKSRKCYPCDPHCDIGSCVGLNDPSKLPPGSCKKCDSGYYLLNNKYCMLVPTQCTAYDTNKGCTGCNTTENKYFLVRHDFRGKDSKLFNISGTRIGMCVPHQKSCPEVNRTSTGCKGCSKGYVLDTIKWTGDDGKEYSIGICSGATSVFILMLIALLVLLF